MPITYFKFQAPTGDPRKPQLMAYGDEQNGSLYLREVSSNLRNPGENEKENIGAFWDREIEKCKYVKDRREKMRNDFDQKQKLEEMKKAKEDQMKENQEAARLEREEAEEQTY